MWTAFGDMNVSIHAISAALQLGDPRTAIDTGEALDLARCPRSHRPPHAAEPGSRARLCDAQAGCRSVNLLLAAERLSPQLVRYDARTRDVLTTLLRREHQPSTPNCARSRTAPELSNPHFRAGFPHVAPACQRVSAAFTPLRVLAPVLPTVYPHGRAGDGTGRW